jgi:hypothetical protein
VDAPKCEVEALPAVSFLLNGEPMDLQEYQKKAFDFTADLTKQLITLSTSIVTVSLLFGEHFPKQSVLAVWAWTFYLVSAVFGLWTLMALTGTLAPVKPPPTDFDIKGNVRLPSALQIVTFGVAVILTIRFAWVWHG